MISNRISSAFAVPFVESEWEDAGKHNQNLSEVFAQLASQGERHQNEQPLVARNNSVFESHFQLFDLPHPAIGALRDFCVLELFKAVQELNGYTQQEMATFQIAMESWFHITQRGGYFAMHNHPMASWSGVYCVAPGDVEGPLDSGLLSFMNPLATNTMYLDMSSTRFSQPYAYGPRNFRLAAGQLLLFPSWVMHEVRPYFGEASRITVAFNVRFRMAGVKRGQVPIYRADQ